MGSKYCHARFIQTEKNIYVEESCGADNELKYAVQAWRAKIQISVEMILVT